jgi:excisionase family DNA binding protein
MAKDKSPDISPALKDFIDTCVVPILAKSYKAAAEKPANPNPYMTIKEAAEYLRATEWTISQAIRAGDLPYAKIGKRFVVCAADLDDYFERQRAAT